MTSRPVTGGRQHRTPATLPKLLTRNPVVCFLGFDEACVDVFGILQRFLKNLQQCENLVINATVGTKTTQDIIQLLVRLFRGIFFQGT